MIKIFPAFLLILFLAFLFSCKQEQPLCFTPPQPTLLRIVDKEGVDLLNPSNINGYKSADLSIYYTKNNVKNYGKIKLDSLPSAKIYFLNTDISWHADKGQEFFLVLSPEISDTIYLRYDQTSEQGCAFYKLVEFKYNNVIYNQTKTDGSFQSYVIVK